MLASPLDSPDANLAGRPGAVAALADRAARRLGLPDEERRTLRLAALLHEVGPALLEPLAEGRDVLSILQAHRERWDGKGYPHGLRGEQIPLGARILAVAEAFEAMARFTPCALGRRPLETLGELKAQAGAQFDPRVVRAFVEER